MTDCRVVLRLNMTRAKDLLILYSKNITSHLHLPAPTPATRNMHPNGREAGNAP